MNAAKYQEIYDVLYANKDYEREVDAIFTLAGSNFSTLLDIGCGTGKHVFEFARRGVGVTGVDIDVQMIEVAKRSTPIGLSRKLEFFHGSALEAPSGPFDGVVSLFNVVNYVREEHGLIAMFSAAFDRVQPGGFFLFDAWNGVAAMTDPPREKEVEIQHDGAMYHCTTKPTLDIWRETVRLDVAISTSDQSIELSHTFYHRLWTPETLRGLTQFAGFETPSIVTWQNLNAPATSTDWKILFFARKAK